MEAIIIKVLSSFGAAFAGAWAAFHYQIYNENKSQLERKIQIINYCQMALGANLETLVNFKKDISIPQLAEVKELKKIPELKKFLIKGEPPNEERMGVLTMNCLVKISPEPIFMELTKLEELSGFAGKYPEIVGIGYRVKKQIWNFSYANKNYNLEVKEFAKSYPKLDIQRLSFLISSVDIISNDT